VASGTQVPQLATEIYPRQDGVLGHLLYWQVTYRYTMKIEHKFEQKKRDFGSINLKQGKGTPKLKNKG